MLEIWAKNARKGLAKHGPNTFSWMRVLPVGVWLVLVVTGLVGWRWFYLNAQRPQHLKEIAAAYGSISMLSLEAQFNHDLSQFTYVAATPTRGVGLFLCDTATRNKRLVGVEKDGTGGWHDDFDLQALPWSPDDSAFLYSMRGSLFVCPVDTNSAAVELKIPTNATVSSVIWLNSLEFVWLEGQTICHAKRPLDGKWTQERFPHRGQVLNLTAIGDHTIAWLQEDFICRLDLSQDWTGTNNPFVPLSSKAYAVPATNDLVLWLDASTLQLSNKAPVKVLEDLSKQGNSASATRNPPTFNAPGSPDALGGKGTIHFESGGALTNAMGFRTSRRLGISGMEPRSVFAVMRRSGGGRSQMLVNIGNAMTNGGYFGFADRNDNLYLPSGSFPGRNDGRLAKLPNGWHMLESIYDGDTNRSYVNGALRGTTTLPFKTVNREVEIGIRTVNTRSLTNMAASDGDFAELLIYNRDLNYIEQRQIEDYLSAKWFGARPLSTANSFVWLDPQMNHLTGFSYSQATTNLLVTQTDNGRDVVWRFDMEDGLPHDPTLVLQGRFLQNLQRTGPKEFAYVSREAGHQGLVLVDSYGTRSDPLFPHADIGWFRVTPDLKKILFWGNMSNEPAPAIWQYDMAGQQLNAVVPGSDQPSSFARNVHSYTGFIRLASGRNIDCTIYPPANFDRNKKYPLVIGDTVISDPIHGQWLQSGIAACGAYVVFVDRPYWYAGITNWEENVRAIYDYLKRDPSIDTKQVYLFGASAETQYMSECMKKTPGLWKGAILLNPGTLPNLSKMPQFQNRPKIFISAGSEENEDQKLKKFQQDARQSGVLVEYIVHPTETHRLVGMDGKLARIQEIVRFIFEE